MKIRRFACYTACMLVVPAAIWGVKRLLRKKRQSVMEEPEDKSPIVESDVQDEIEEDFVKKRAEFNERLEHLEKVENTKEMKKRYARYKDFDEFHKVAKKAFETLRDNDRRGKVYEAFNKLCVCPGSRMGMDKRDIVEVFWGSKIYDSEYKDKSGNRQRFKFNTEKGATLYFLRKDSGLVSIYLFPSETEKRKCEEDGILLKDDVEPNILLGTWYQKRLWWSFMAYTEVTSLDGSPTIWQRMRVAKNRFVKPLIVGDEVRQRVVVKWIGRTIWWVFMVGMSGSFVTAYYEWKNDDRDALNQKVERIENTLKDTATRDSVEISAVSKLVDSLNVSMREMMKLQKRQKK